MIADNLRKVLAAVEAASTRLSRPVPRLVAVSKTNPAEAVQEAYDAGQRHFGENYVQELLEKAPALPSDVRWHFIGQLQSNKAKALVAGVPNLWAVESVDSIKLAGLLEKGMLARLAASPPDAPSPPPSPLRVFIQVNTSGEPQKGGVEPGGEATTLARYIIDSCPHLALAGLMTIGKLGECASIYFERLVAEREGVATALGLEPATLELSMGMSSDWELALGAGATSIRVGSSIFGARAYPGSKPVEASSSSGGSSSSGSGGSGEGSATA